MLNCNLCTVETVSHCYVRARDCLALVCACITPSRIRMCVHKTASHWYVRAWAHAPVFDRTTVATAHFHLNSRPEYAKSTRLIRQCSFLVYRPRSGKQAIAYCTCLNVRSITRFALQVTSNYSKIFSNWGVDLCTGNAIYDAISCLKMRIDYTRGQRIHGYIRYSFLFIYYSIKYFNSFIGRNLNFWLKISSKFCILYSNKYGTSSNTHSAGVDLNSDTAVFLLVSWLRRLRLEERDGPMAASYWDQSARGQLAKILLCTV